MACSVRRASSSVRPPRRSGCLSAAPWRDRAFHRTSHRASRRYCALATSADMIRYAALTRSSMGKFLLASNTMPTRF